MQSEHFHGMENTTRELLIRPHGFGHRVTKFVQVPSAKKAARHNRNIFPFDLVAQVSGAQDEAMVPPKPGEFRWVEMGQLYA